MRELTFAYKLLLTCSRVVLLGKSTEDVPVSDDQDREALATRRGTSRATAGTVIGILAVVVAVTGIYLGLAATQHWAPFEQACQSPVNAVPPKLDRTTAGANADGNARALVFSKPSSCTSNTPITGYSIKPYDFNTKSFLSP